MNPHVALVGLRRQLVDLIDTLLHLLVELAEDHLVLCQAPPGGALVDLLSHKLRIPCNDGLCTFRKYEVVDPKATDEKEYIWFDDGVHQLRRTRTENREGFSEQTFEYGGAAGIEPAGPVVE